MAIKHHSNENFLDSNKLMFGTGEDLQILHDGSNSYIHHNGTGSLYMKADTGDINIINYTNDKDIILQSDDGSGGVTPYLTLDGSTAKSYFSTRLGVGIADPVSSLHVYEDNTAASTTAGLTIEQRGTGDAIAQFLLTGVRRWVIGADNSDLDKFKIASSGGLASDAHLTIDTSGNVGIGTTSPSSKLHVNGTFIVAEDSEKGLDINGQSYVYKLGDIDAGESQTYIEVDSVNAKTTLHNSTLELGHASDTTIARSAAGTVEVEGNQVVTANVGTGNLMHIVLKDMQSYSFYIYNDDSWYSNGTGTLAILGSSTDPSAISSSNSEYQSRVPSYIAPQGCIVKKLCFSFYWSSSAVNSADIDFGFSKFTPISDGTAASITMNKIAATDHNGSYTEVKPYYKTFTFSGPNATLAAGDAFAMHMRTTGGSSAQRVLVYATATLEIELT